MKRRFDIFFDRTVAVAINHFYAKPNEPLTAISTKPSIARLRFSNLLRAAKGYPELKHAFNP